MIDYRASVLVAVMLSLPAGALTAGSALKTSGGFLEGITTASAKEYFGIPYAAPPVGALRWKPPQPGSWSGVLAADNLPPACPQNEAARRIAPAGGTATTSENCLFLNVYAPLSRANNLPVMVWLHGGGNEVGTGSSYDGSALVQNGVIVVTINYRLGLLGFLAAPALDSESPIKASGDYGLMDQEAALAWVRRNIAAFGGDPANVTVFGQGQGGQDASDLLAAPGAAGLFERAIIESGAYGVQLPTHTSSSAAGAAFATSVGCSSTTNASCLRALSVSKLLAAEVGPGSPYLTQNALRFEPSVGTTTLPIQPIFAYALGTPLNRVPVLVGTTREDARLPVANNFDYSGAPLTAAGYTAAIESVGADASIVPLITQQYLLADYPTAGLAFSALFTDVGFACISQLNDQLLSNSMPTYTFEFGDENADELLLPPDPFMDLAAADTTELPFLWPNLVGTNGASRSAFAAPEQALAVEMRAAWTNFAKSGNPNGFGVTTWPSFTITNELFQELAPGTVAATAGFTADHRCGFWEPLEVVKALTAPTAG